MKTISNLWRCIASLLLFAPLALLAQGDSMTGYPSQGLWSSSRSIKQLFDLRPAPHILGREVACEKSINLVPLVKGFGYASIEPSLNHQALEFEEGIEGVVTPYIMLPHFDNITIRGIECVVDEAVEDARVIVARVRQDDTNGLSQEILVSQPATLQEGYNQVLLDEPQKVSAKDLVLVGYSCPATSVKGSNSSPVLYDGDREYCLPEANMVALSTAYYEQGKSYSFSQVQDTEPLELGSALIYALVDDPDGHYDYIVYPLKQPRYSLLTSKEYFRYDILVRNIGFEEITSMTFLEKYHHANYGMREKQYPPFEIPVPVKGICEVAWTHPPYPEGTSKGSVELLSIDDQSVIEKGMIKWVFDAFNPTEKGSMERKSVLVEYYTSESAPDAPRYNALINQMAEDLVAKGYEVSCVAYPVGGEEVAFAKEACNEELATLLGQVPYPTPSQLPYFSINRAPYLSERRAFAFVSKDQLFGKDQKADADLLEPFLQEKERAFISDIVCHDLPGGKTSLEVKGKLLYDADPDDLYLTAVVTEDNVKAQDQKGTSSGEEYLHQHMVRAYYTSNLGTNIMPEADGTFDYQSPEIALDPSWKKENLKVVLFLHRDPTYVNKISCHVYSSKTIPFGGSFSGVTAPQVNESSTRLYQDASGLLQIEGDHEQVVVYSLEGQCVAESLPAQLPPGSYVVVVSHSQGTRTLHKVVVK